MQDTKLVLRDQLCHPHYSWPESLVFLPATEQSQGAVHVVDGRGTQRPAQWVMRDGKAQLALVTNLPSGETRSFQVVSGSLAAGALRMEKDDECIRVESSQLCLTVFLGQDSRLFSLSPAAGGYEGIASLDAQGAIARKDVRVPDAGDVFADICVRVDFADGKSYALTIRIAQEMEFLTLTERMTGFVRTDEASMTITWQDFAPGYRNNHYRKTELIDQYLGGDGLIPLKVAPFDSWVRWWQDKAISFMDEQAGSSVSVFIRQADLWDDGEYAIWRSSQTLAVRFYYADEQLRCVYPLSEGCRSTGLATFLNSRERALEFGGVSDGLYAQDKKSPIQSFYSEELWFWHEFVALDKVKDWTLRWDEDRSAFPRFFAPDALPPAGMNLWYLGRCWEPVTPTQVEKVVYELSDSLNQMIRTGAVSNREFYDWAVMYDHAIPQMTEKQFGALRAAFAFSVYAFSDENYMPVRRMLAGHPNFLADTRGVAAVAAAMFPAHPDALLWKDNYELSMARNLKYHTRPDVRAWDCKGGRWTENLGAYLFAMLRPVIDADTLVQKTYGENTILYPALLKVMDYILGTMSAPVEGTRRMPSMGAHSDVRKVDIYELTLWGDALFRYAPRLAENLWYLADPGSRGFEEKIPGTSVYRTLAGKTYPIMTGTRPELESAKYTGFGCVLRANVYEPDEMTVELTQIDDGPNYRWGRAAEGGCGAIWYYANQRQYSGQRREDVGDWNKGAVQSCCNFGVLIDQQYVSVGRNDLTEPLFDFGFAKYACVLANEKAQPFYRSRSVIMSGNDYITIYDAVGDLRVHGRFSWFNDAKEKMPDIVQLKPGVGFVESNGGIPVDEPGAQADEACLGRYYEGDGDFLTLVSHRSVNADRGTYTTVRPEGVLVELQSRTDHVFHRAGKIKYNKDGIRFIGHAGIVRVYGETRAEAAVFDGTDVQVLGFSLHIAQTAASKAGAGFTIANGRVCGQVQTREAVTVTLAASFPLDGYALYVDGVAVNAACTDGKVSFTVPAGACRWELTDALAEPPVPAFTRVVTSAGQADIAWTRVPLATLYRLEVSGELGKTWQSALETKETRGVLTGLANGTKQHIRVRALNGDRLGKPCWDEPVYTTDAVPEAPNGLRVWEKPDGYQISWGEQLGVSAYRCIAGCTGKRISHASIRGRPTALRMPCRMDWPNMPSAPAMETGRVRSRMCAAHRRMAWRHGIPSRRNHSADMAPAMNMVIAGLIIGTAMRTLS